jgi:hypothetical protein
MRRNPKTVPEWPVANPSAPFLCQTLVFHHFGWVVTTGGRYQVVTKRKGRYKPAKSSKAPEVPDLRSNFSAVRLQITATLRGILVWSSGPQKRNRFAEHCRHIVDGGSFPGLPTSAWQALQSSTIRRWRAPEGFWKSRCPQYHRVLASLSGAGPRTYAQQTMLFARRRAS